MAKSAGDCIADHVIRSADLKTGFKQIARDAIYLKAAMWFCGFGFLMAGAKIAHHVLDLPGLTFLWDFVVSICT